MPLLESWFPSVGMFGIVLVVTGSLVSLLARTARKRFGLALVFILLGLGEFGSIHKADRIHENEVHSQHNDVENLTEQLQKSEMRRQVDNAILLTKLEDYAGLSQIGPALIKLAQTSAAFQKKQYETKITSDRDLYDLTMKAVKQIRDFSTKYAELKGPLGLSNSISGPTSEVERQQKLSEEMNKTFQMYRAKHSEFQASILPDAVYARNELLRRRLPEPPLEPSDRVNLNIALKGMLAGINPEISLANHLELWAKPLGRK